MTLKKTENVENKASAKEEKKETRISKMVDVICFTSLLASERYQEGERYRISRAFLKAFPFNFKEIRRKK